MKPYPFNISLPNSLTDFQEFFSIRDEFGLELGDGFLDLELFLFEALLEEELELVEGSGVVFELVFELQIFPLV